MSRTADAFNKTVSKPTLLETISGAMKILYIENHPKFSSLISRHLLSEHSVVIVPSITEAASKISTDVYDLVLLDYDLDDGKGVELMPLLRNLSNQPKIIAVSSHEDGNNALLAAGADAVCYKKDISKIGAVIQSLDCLEIDPF